MQQTLKISTRVLPGHRIEVTAPDMPEGESVDVVADLRDYRSEVHGILMRHVIEHNYDWQKVLDNALASCSKLALVIFTPFASETHVIHEYTDPPVPDISFKHSDLTELFPSYTEESFSSGTQYGAETIFYVEGLWKPAR